MNTRLRLGMLTPSSNTVLELHQHADGRGTSEVSVHFGRFKVTEIALSDQALKQFDDTRDIARGGISRPCQGRCDFLERHIRELAWFLRPR